MARTPYFNPRPDIEPVEVSTSREEAAKKVSAEPFHKDSAEVRIYLIFYKPNISEFISFIFML